MAKNDEQVNIYDDKGNFLQSMNRLQAEAENHRTENVIILVLTPEGKLWTQRRAAYKQYYANMWDVSAVGGVESGEHRDQAAQRETLEEMGIQPTLTYIQTIKRDLPSGTGIILPRYSHVYIGNSKEEPTPNEEVVEFKAWDIQELLEDMSSQPSLYLPKLIPLVELAQEFLDTKNPSS